MAIAKLSIDLEARLASFEKDMKTMASLSEGAAKRIESAFRGVGPLFAGITGALSVGAFAAGIAKTIEFAGALDDMAERTGATVENLSALSGVAKIGGHDLELVESSVIKLNKALHGSDDESKGAAKALAAIGLSVDDLKSKDPAEAMLEVAKALDKFADGGGKSAVAIALLGKSGAQALPFLKDLAEKGELVGKITSEQAAQAEQYEKNMARLTTQMSAFSKAVALEMLPALNNLSSELAAGSQAAGGFWSFFGTTLTTNPLKNIQENISDTRSSIAELERDKEKGVKIDEARYSRLIAKEKTLKAVAQSRALQGSGDGNMDANDRRFQQQKPSLDDVKLDPDKKPKKTGAAKVDAANQLIQSLNQQIAVKEADALTTDKMTESEKQAVKIRFDLENGTLKATAAQRASINADLDKLVALDKALTAQKEYQAAVDRQDNTNLKSYQTMIDRIAAVERETELYGLTEAQISVVEQARLRDAIAMAKENGAYPEHIAFLEKELERRALLSDALSGKERKAYESEDAIKALQSLKEMDEFAKSAAKNIQDTLADFLFDPFADGLDGMAQKFGQTIQRMVADAAAAQLARSLFGDMGKTGEVGGWVGTAFTALKDILPSFDVGTDYVPRDMVAQIHKGERIVPAAQNKPGLQGGSISLTQHFHGQTDARTVKRAGAATLREVQALMANSARVA
jgi:hypothetical protein